MVSHGLNISLYNDINFRGDGSVKIALQSVFEGNMRFQQSELDKSRGYIPKLVYFTHFPVCVTIPAQGVLYLLFL